MPAFQQRFFPDVYRQTHDSSGAVSMYCQARQPIRRPCLRWRCAGATASFIPERVATASL